MKGNIPAARLLEPRALQRLITAWQESGASDESARQAMAAVRAVMGWMYEAGHLKALPPARRAWQSDSSMGRTWAGIERAGARRPMP